MPYRNTNAEARIRRAISRMPYGAMSEIDRAASRVGLNFHTPEPMQLEDVAEYLEQLAVTFDQITKEHVKEHEEYVRLKNDVAAMRRVLGVP